MEQVSEQSLQMSLLDEFKKKYSGILTSGDLQTFILGAQAMQEALKKEIGIKGNLCQLDEEDEQAGLIITDASTLIVQDEWPKFRFNSDDATADTFVDYLIEKGFKAERVYTEEIGPRG